MVRLVCHTQRDRCTGRCAPAAATVRCPGRHGDGGRADARSAPGCAFSGDRSGQDAHTGQLAGAGNTVPAESWSEAPPIIHPSRTVDDGKTPPATSLHGSGVALQRAGFVPNADGLVHRAGGRAFARSKVCASLASTFGGASGFRLRHTPGRPQGRSRWGVKREPRRCEFRGCAESPMRWRSSSPPARRYGRSRLRPLDVRRSQ